MTFDDLPHAVSGGAISVPTAEAAISNRRILAALKRFRAPATGFVYEAKVRALGPAATAMLEGWNRGDYELANHSFSHADANALDLAGIEREIVEGEPTIGQMARSAGRRIRFFRFPYNHRGDTAEKQASVQSFLMKRGYILAASTIDTSDYVFDAAFERALSERNRIVQERIKRAYLDHTARQIEYYASLNRLALGYEPPGSCCCTSIA